MDGQELILKLGQIQNHGFKHIEQVFGLDENNITYQLEAHDRLEPNAVLIDMDRIEREYHDIFSTSLSFPFEYEIVKQWVRIGLHENAYLNNRDLEHIDSAVKGLTVGHLEHYTLYQGHKAHKEFLTNLLRYEINRSDSAAVPETMLSKVQDTRAEGLKRAVNRFYHELKDGWYLKRN